MTYAGVVRLEERIHLSKEPRRPITAMLKDFFADIFSHERYVCRQMKDFEAHGKLVEAADCAVQLEQYEHAFQLYNRHIAKGNVRTNLRAAELAEFQQDYKQALQYRLNAEDYGNAGLDALHLGRLEEAQKYFRILREG